jgi:hypothetical protein
MADSKSTAKVSKLMDVARPGKSAPSASAKPIIVTNRPIIKQDPMMAPDNLPTSVSQGRDPAELVTRASKPLRIEPISHDDTAASVATSIKVTDAAAPAAQTTDPTPVSTVVPSETPGKLSITPFVLTEAPQEVEPSASEPTSVSAAPSASAESVLVTTESQTVEVPKTDHPAEPEPAPEASPASTAEPSEEIAEEPTDGGTDKQLPANQAIEDAKKKEEEAKAAKVAEQEKIIASRKFYLPISTAKQRRGFWVAVLLVVIVLLLAAVWLDVALDAGIVHIGGLHPLTHMFNLS